MFHLLLLAVICAFSGVIQGASFHTNHGYKVETGNTDVNEMTNKLPPGFCNKLDCPKFEVVNKTDKYELRKYMTTHWLTTQEVGVDYNEAQYTMFMRLFNYIQGENAKKEKIAMTTPVIVKIIPGEGPACASNFTMSFYVSQKTGTYPPPAPSSPLVQITQLPTLMAYVSSFGGHASIQDYLKEAKALAKSVPKDASYHKEFFYTGAYNSPFQIFNRHNEVWFIAK